MLNTQSELYKVISIFLKLLLILKYNAQNLKEGGISYIIEEEHPELY